MVSELELVLTADWRIVIQGRSVLDLLSGQVHFDTLAGEIRLPALVERDQRSALAQPLAHGRRDMLDLEVWDDGPGLPKGKSANGGLGLANTRARLEQLYGDGFTFEPSNTPGGGFRVAISIPFRPALLTPETEEEFA